MNLVWLFGLAWIPWKFMKLAISRFSTFLSNFSTMEVTSVTYNASWVGSNCFSPTCVSFSLEQGQKKMETRKLRDTNSYIWISESHTQIHFFFLVPEFSVRYGSISATQIQAFDSDTHLILNSSFEFLQIQLLLFLGPLHFFIKWQLKSFRITMKSVSKKSRPPLPKLWSWELFMLPYCMETALQIWNFPALPLHLFYALQTSSLLKTTPFLRRWVPVRHFFFKGSSALILFSMDFW